MRIMKFQLITTFFFISFNIFCQIPIKEYQNEIQKLKNKEEIDRYWRNLENIDQKILVNTTNMFESDSISICNMIRTALMFEMVGNKCYKQNNTVPLLNFSHSQISESNIIFWPIILKCAKIGGVIESFGGKFPAYQLEAISLEFYNYSLFNQELIYEQLMNKIKIDTSTAISTKLLNLFEKQKKMKSLKQLKIIGKWNLQSFENRKEIDFFELVKMSDKSIYLKKNKRLQKLILIKSNKFNFKYKIENEPFGWFYELNNGELSLKNDNNKNLLEYSKYK